MIPINNDITIDLRPASGETSLPVQQTGENPAVSSLQEHLSSDKELSTLSSLPHKGPGSHPAAIQKDILRSSACIISRYPFEKTGVIGDTVSGIQIGDMTETSSAPAAGLPSPSAEDAPGMQMPTAVPGHLNFPAPLPSQSAAGSPAQNLPDAGFSPVKDSGIFQTPAAAGIQTSLPQNIKSETATDTDGMIFPADQTVPSHIQETATASGSHFSQISPADHPIAGKTPATPNTGTDLPAVPQAPDSTGAVPQQPLTSNSDSTDPATGSPATAPAGQSTAADSIVPAGLKNEAAAAAPAGQSTATNSTVPAGQTTAANRTVPAGQSTAANSTVPAGQSTAANSTVPAGQSTAANSAVPAGQKTEDTAAVPAGQSTPADSTVPGKHTISAENHPPQNTLTPADLNISGKTDISSSAASTVSGQKQSLSAQDAPSVLSRQTDDPLSALSEDTGLRKNSFRVSSDSKDRHTAVNTIPGEAADRQPQTVDINPAAAMTDKEPAVSVQPAKKSTGAELRGISTEFLSFRDNIVPAFQPVAGPESAASVHQSELISVIGTITEHLELLRLRNQDGDMKILLPETTLSGTEIEIRSTLGKIQVQFNVFSHDTFTFLNINQNYIMNQLASNMKQFVGVQFSDLSFNAQADRRSHKRG